MIASDITIIAPLAPWEKNLPTFVDHVTTTLAGAKLLVAGPQRPNGIDYPPIFVETPLGRAKQMNAAAKHATTPYLWFVHIDSTFDQEALPGLLESIARQWRAVHFFDLAFDDDDLPLTRLNQLGTFFRSRVLKMPFGDQAFAMPRELFWELGGFDESASYGEDHLLIWAAHHAGVPVVPVGRQVVTSARKYRERGWGATTLRHVWLTYKQAAPEGWRWLTRRGRKAP